MFIDYVVNIDVNSPTGITTRNNLFQYAWVVENDSNNELATPKLVAGNDFANYFTAQEMIDFGATLGTKEIYLVNNRNLTDAHDTCFWLVDSLAVLNNTELNNFKGFKVLTSDDMESFPSTNPQLPSTPVAVKVSMADTSIMQVDGYVAVKVLDGSLYAGYIHEDQTTGNVLLMHVVSINGNDVILDLNIPSTITLPIATLNTGVIVGNFADVDSSGIFTTTNGKATLVLNGIAQDTTNPSTAEIVAVDDVNKTATLNITYTNTISIEDLTFGELVDANGDSITNNKPLASPKTKAMEKYTAVIIDGNTITSPYEILSIYLSRTVANLNDMQYMPLSTWKPVLNNEAQYLSAFNSNLIFANTPDSATPAVELANLKMGGVSWTRLLIGEVIKQALQNDIKLFIQNSNLHMEHEDYVLIEDRGNNLLSSYIKQNLIGDGATFIVDYNQLSVDGIQGTLKNVRVNLDGINSLWRVEGIIYS